MPVLTPHPFDAYVIAATFLDHVPAFALADGSVRLIGAGGAATAVQAHDGGLLAAQRTLDGKALVSGGDDGRVVQVKASGERAVMTEMPRKWIDKIACGPQGAVAYAVGRTAWVRLASGEIKEFPHEKAVGGLAFLPKGLRLVTATTDMARLLWVNTNGAPVDYLWKGAHTGATVSPDGRFLVTTMQELALHGWRIEDGKHMRMTGYPAKVKSVSWSAKGKYLATSGADAAILWPFQAKDGPMGKPPLQLGVYPKQVTQVACHPTEDVVAIGYADGLIMAVRFADQAEVVFRPPGDGAVSALGWADDGTQLAFGTDSGAAGLIDITK